MPELSRQKVYRARPMKDCVGKGQKRKKAEGHTALAAFHKRDFSIEQQSWDHHSIHGGHDSSYRVERRRNSMLSPFSIRLKALEVSRIAPNQGNVVRRRISILENIESHLPVCTFQGRGSVQSTRGIYWQSGSNLTYAKLLSCMTSIGKSI